MYNIKQSEEKTAFFSSDCFMFYIFIFYQTTIIIWKKKLYILLITFDYLILLKQNIIEIGMDRVLD